MSTNKVIKLAEKLENKYAASYEVPLKCKLGLHDWGPWIKVRIRHEGKPGEREKGANPDAPIKQWVHECGAEKRFCKACGKNSPLKDVCSGRITPVFESKKDNALNPETFGDFSAERV